MDKPELAPSFWQLLAIENPLGLITITEQDARDWFEVVWPSMREFYAEKRGKPRWRLRIVKFWANLSERDLERARISGQERRRSEEAVQLQSLADRVLTDDFGTVDESVVIPPMRVRR